MPAQEQQPGTGRTGMMGFRKSARDAPRLPKDAARRQGAITTLAFELLGGRDGAIAFLNTADSGLGGRPIDLATASAVGFQKVEQALLQLKSG